MPAWYWASNSFHWYSSRLITARDQGRQAACGPPLSVGKSIMGAPPRGISRRPAAARSGRDFRHQLQPLLHGHLALAQRDFVGLAQAVEALVPQLDRLGPQLLDGLDLAE